MKRNWIILTFILLFCHYDAVAQDRFIQFGGGTLLSGFIIATADSPNNVSALRLGLGVAGGILGVYVVGREVTDNQGSLRQCIITGGLGGVISGMYLVHLHRTKSKEATGQAVFDLELIGVEKLVKYSVLIVPGVLGAVLGYNHRVQKNAILNMKSGLAQMAIPRIMLAEETDFLNRRYAVSSLKLIEYAF